ncbi:MAG TPA: sigma-70 family RNA polymerase sigma factor [Actinomycetota bacterium]|nr:sigma-70 family RNA polymerase sigma factor [Actinomycetota bacterium]
MAELYERNVPDAVRLAYLLTGNREVAQDLAHEAFIRAVGRLAHLRQADAFGPYLRRAVVNLSRNHFRSRSRERSALQRSSPPPGRETSPSAERTVVDRDALRSVLLELPERQREAIVLRFYLDLSDGQAAEAMRCRPGTVRSLVSRGMHTLRSNLESNDA